MTSFDARNDLKPNIFAVPVGLSLDSDTDIIKLSCFCASLGVWFRVVMAVYVCFSRGPTLGGGSQGVAGCDTQKDFPSLTTARLSLQLSFTAPITQSFSVLGKKGPFD